MDMEHKKAGKTRETGNGALLLLGGVFLLGALAGSLCCANVPPVAQRFFPPGQAGGYWENFRADGLLLGVIFLSGFLRTGCPLIFLAVSAKGFLTAARAAGWMMTLQQGWIAAISQMLLPGFLSLAAMVLLGRQALHQAVQRQRKPLLPDGTYLLTGAICLVLTALAAAAAWQISPRIWETVQTFLPIT